MLIFILGVILLVASLIFLIISSIKMKNWKCSDAWETVFICSLIPTILGVIIVVSTSIIAIVKNSSYKKNSIRNSYNEIVESLEATKVYIETIEDDYARSVAVSNYNKSVRDIKIEIKNAKLSLNNIWLNWYECSIYKEFNEDELTYIK